MQTLDLSFPHRDACKFPINQGKHSYSYILLGSKKNPQLMLIFGFVHCIPDFISCLEKQTRDYKKISIAYQYDSCLFRKLFSRAS